ncbi:uncharacterized protein Tco025E_05007 [Trypanosoma conorhini]|uniref:Uncharacterized protein n=1 Tax=Trypanosoma conorhini TaxID=83891 RepID=A0A422PGN2_9TRYP|nr:uncharacterized protein Tco025E_05007 [Trypanosoma conorhini]RNF16882.1 hypothetical protein Tco025E_05007 [Trypanosoma conorhini]
MYTDDFPQRRNALKKAERLKSKAARRQEKRLMHPFCFSCEEVRAAGEFGAPPPSYASSTTASSLEWLAGEDRGLLRDVGQTAAGGDTRRAEPGGAGRPELSADPQCRTAPPTGCEVAGAPSAEPGRCGHEAKGAAAAVEAEEEVVVVVAMRAAAEGRGASVAAPESNDRGDRQKPSALSTSSLSSLMILSENLEAKSSSRGGGDAADSSIVLDTGDECDSDLLPPDDEVFSITLSSTATDTPPPSPPTSPHQGQNNNASHRATDAADGLRTSKASVASQLTPAAGTPRVENEAAVSVAAVGAFEEEQPPTPPHAGGMGGEVGKTPRPSSSPSPLLFHGGKQWHDGRVVSPAAPAAVAPPLPSLGAERSQSSPQPRCFDRYVLQGRAKRRQREEEEEERQQRLKEAEERRYTPQVSLYAEQRGSRSLAEYIAASRAWEQRRTDHVKSVEAQIEAAEERMRRAAVRVNATSERIVREMEERRKRIGVVEGATQHAAFRQSLLRRLQKKYAPSFKPVITAVAGRRKAAEGQTRQEGGRHSGLGDFYDRFSRYRDASDKKRERLLQSATAQQAAPPTQRRTMAHIKEYARSMWEQDERRRDKLRRQVERERQEEEEQIRAMRPQVNRRSAELAERFRERQRTAATAASTSTSVPPMAGLRRGGTRQQPRRATSGKRGSPPPKRPPPPTNRKLAFSTSNSCSGPQKPGASGPKETVTPAISPDFEERNAQLLRMRKQRAESLRHEAEKEIAETCTFKPQVDPVSRRMVEAHYRHHLRPHAFHHEPPSCFGEHKCPSSSAAARTGARNGVDGDVAWASGVRVAKDVDDRVESISCHPDDEDGDGGTNDDGEDDLAAQIESLESMLTQWKQLEAEYRV